MQIDINHENYKDGRKGMGGKRIVHRIVFVRHGETSANVALMSHMDEDMTSHSLNTTLTEEGVHQGEDVASYLMEGLHYMPDEIIYSRLDRAYRTALPALTLARSRSSPPLETKDALWAENNYKQTETIIDHEHVEWVYEQETHDVFVDRIFSAFDTLRRQGTTSSPKQTVVFTHSQVINTVLSRCLSSEVLPQPEPHYFHLSNGSLTCIDIDECGHCHVQAVNFTRHLTTPSGHHSPFV